MAVLNKLMARGIVPPEVHGVLDYPLAAIIIAGPVVFDFDHRPPWRIYLRCRPGRLAG